MVARNGRPLDQLIDAALGDTGTQLHAFETPPELSTEMAPKRAPSSAWEKRDNVAGPSE